MTQNTAEYRCDRCGYVTTDADGFSIHMAEEAGYFLTRAVMANAMPRESRESRQMRIDGLTAIATRAMQTALKRS